MAAPKPPPRAPLPPAAPVTVGPPPAPAAAPPPTATPTRARFGKALGRFSIGSLDDELLTVVAQFNPKQLKVERDIKWKQGDLRDNRPEWLRARTGRPGHTGDIEYTGAETRTASFELLLDGYEDGVSIEPDVRALEEMACVRDPDSTDDELRRPHHCVVVYGEQQSSGGLAKLRCVITNLTVTYSMFSNHGIPLRATANITVKEAHGLVGHRGETTVRVA